MSKEKNEEVIIDVEQVYTKSESWVIENQKSLSIIVGAIVLMLGSYFAYKNFVYMPQEEEAREFMWRAQNAFASDSLELSLNGKPGTDFLGFLEIIDQYGITEQANLAHYYAGVAYLRLGDFDQAIEFLESYDCQDVMVCAISIGATGDAYMEKGEVDRAIDYYLSAVDHSQNDFTAPIYLMKAAGAQESQGNYTDAVANYKRIKMEFPKSTQSQSIDKYIARAEGLAGN